MDDADVANGSPDEARRRTRYVVRSVLSGFFGAVEVSVCDISETGLQIAHVSPLRPGTRARGGISWRGRVTAFQGVVTWCRLSTLADADGRFVYRSGVRVESPDAELVALVGTLAREADLFEDRGSMSKKAAKLAARLASRTAEPKMRVLRSTVPIPPDQLLLVQQARIRLRTHPEEALKWYNRGRFALTDHGSEVADSPFRDEILAVWEYLEHTVDLRLVVRIFEAGS